MRISVNCPSYKRPKVETLDYLPYCKVWVAEREYPAYLEANPEFRDNIISVPNEVQGNLCRIRNYILDKELPENDVVVIVDDDLQYMERFEPKGTFGYDRVRIDADEFLWMVERYTILCDDFGYKFWGVMCNADAMAYNQARPFATISYIGGPFQAFLNGNPLRYDERLPLKEDYDMTLQNCNMYRGCLRVNKIHYYAKQSKQAGGCATYRNLEREKEQLELLRKKWGSKIVQNDIADNLNQKKQRRTLDYNPVIKVPIKGL